MHRTRAVRLSLALVLAIASLVCGGGWGAGSAQAEGSLPTGALTQVRALPTLRTSAYQDWNWATPDDAYLYRDPAGDVAVATHVGTELQVDTYDPATFAPVGSPRTISLTGWPAWGGFYAAPNGDLFVLVGRDNPNELDDRDVVAVRRYSSDWQLLGTAFVKGGASQLIDGIYEPFDAGAPDMLQVGNRLVVHMSRLMYADAGVHHQANLTFEVDLATMTARTFDEVGGDPFGDSSYSSHSFAQYLATAGSSLLMVDHGDAYPRAIQLGVMAGYPTSRSVQTYDLFAFNGGIGDNFTGATVDGLVSGPGGAVVVGTSIRQPNAPDGPLGSDTEARNAFIVHADPATGAHTTTWLTNLAPDGAATALEPRVVQVAANRWAVVFSVREGTGYRTEYRLIDSAGTVLASTTFPGSFFSSVTDPVLVGSSVLWVGVRDDVAVEPMPAYLYGLDVTDPTAPAVLGGEGGAGPVNVTAPRLHGRAVVGSTLTISPGEWDPAADAYGYRWFRDDVRMRSVTGTTYAVRGRDRGTAIRVKVVATNADGSGSAWSNTKRVR